MIDSLLSSRVEQLAQTALATSDAGLDRAWAWRSYDSEGVRFAFFRTYEELRELAVKLRRERMTNGPPFSSAQLILSSYHSAYNDLQASLLGIGNDLADRPPADGEWPLRKVEAKRLLRMICAALADLEGALIGAWEIGEESRRQLGQSLQTRSEEITTILA